MEDLLFLNLAQNKAKQTDKNVQHGWGFFSCYVSSPCLFGSFAISAVALFFGKFGSNNSFLYRIKAILSLFSSSST